jgi:hypothetical protein
MRTAPARTVAGLAVGLAAGLALLGCAPEAEDGPTRRAMLRELPRLRRGDVVRVEAGVAA